MLGLSLDSLGNVDKPYLIMYGTMDTTMHANAAQVKAKPDPDDTTIPTEMGGSPMSRLLTASVRLMRTVQMLAPMRISKLPTMENSVETKKVKLRLRTPLLPIFLKAFSF